MFFGGEVKYVLAFHATANKSLLELTRLKFIVLGCHNAKSQVVQTSTSSPNKFNAMSTHNSFD